MQQVGNPTLSTRSQFRRDELIGTWISGASVTVHFARVLPYLICLAIWAIATLGPASATGQSQWQWRQASPVPEARSEVSVAGDGSYVYFLGGFAEGPSAPTGMFRYDPESDVWAELPSLSEGRHHAGLAVLDNKLVLIGGYRGTSWEPLADVQILDLKTRTWRQARPMPTPRGALAVAVLDGKIHAIGGHDGERSLAVHEIYDPVADEWTTAAPIASPRNHHASAVLAGRIYIFGGRDEATAEMDSTEVYAAAADRWDSAAPLPAGRSGIAAAVIDGRAVVFGGETFGAERKTFGEAELYDPQADSWSSLPPMPQSRHGLGAATIGSRIYVIAGGPTAGLSFSAENSYLERIGPADMPEAGR